MSNNGSAPSLPAFAGRTGPLAQPAVPLPHGQQRPSEQPQPPDSVEASSGTTSPRRMSDVDVDGSGTQRVPSRSFGVHSILNPSHVEEAEPHGRRRSAAQMEESTSEGAVSNSMTRPTSSAGVASGEISPTGLPTRTGMPRRILTPISPTIYRTASLGRIVTGNLPSIPGTIDAQQSPFLSPAGARMHAIEPGTGGVAQLPGPPPQQAMQKAGLPMPHAPTPPIVSQPRRESVGLVRSARASPSPSYSSYSPSGQLSPALQYAPSSGPTPPGSSGLAPSPMAGPLSAVPPGPLDFEPLSGIPVVSTGQSSYQLMAIPTAKGPVQIPVEMQAASRMADEKRKRNAGASARFRQRRKEKEREASTRIAVLERQVADAVEEAEWYKKERQELLIALQALPGGERYLRRERSPRSRRLDAPDQATSTQSSSYTFDRAGPSNSEPNTRRRVDMYTLPPPSTADQAESPYAPSSYPAPPYQPASSAQNAANLTPRGFGEPALLPRDTRFDGHPSQAPPR